MKIARSTLFLFLLLGFSGPIVGEMSTTGALLAQSADVAADTMGRGATIISDSATTATMTRTEPSPTMGESAVNTFPALLSKIQETSVSYFPKALGALVVLVLGWLLALFVTWVTRTVLRKTKLDEKLSVWTAGEDAETRMVVSGWVAKGIFYLTMLFVVVAVLQTLELTILTDPINQMLGKLFTYVPNLLGAAVLFIVAWIIAGILRFAVTRLMVAMKFDDRFATEADRKLPDGFSLSHTTGNILYWITFLMFLPAILSTLGMEGMIGPVQGMLDTVLNALPNALAAVLIFMVGWLVARIVSRFVSNVLVAFGADAATKQTAIRTPLGDRSLSRLIGSVVYALIIIPVAIASLDALKIEAISQPAIRMLTTVLQAVPAIFAAIVLLLVAYVAARILQGLAGNVLSASGFNRLPVWLGLSEEPIEGDRSPSEVGGYIVLVAIMLFAAVEALDLLGFGLLAGLMASVVAAGGKILLGLLVFAVGLYLANLAQTFVGGSGTERSRMYGLVVRYAVIIFVGAMALREMGIAEDIINLTFGILLGAVAIAGAIAFGIGSRDIAGKQMERWMKEWNAKK